MKIQLSIVLTILFVIGLYTRAVSQQSAVESEIKLNSFQDSIRKYSRKDPALAISYFSEALRLTLNSKDKKTEARLYNLAGNVYEQSGDFEKSLEHYLKALRISEALRLTKDVSVHQISIGGLYTELGQYDLARQYIEKALSSATANNDSLGMAKACNNLGNVFQKSGDLEKALINYRKTLLICEQKNILKGISIAANNIANVYKDLKQFEPALQSYLRAREIAIKEKDLGAQAFYMNNIGALYNDQENFDKALEYILEALPVAEDSNDKTLLINVYAQLSRTYFGKKQYKDAYIVLNKYNLLTEKIFNETSSRKVAEMQALYETEKKELQIQNLRNQNEKQTVINNALNMKKNIIIGCIAVGMFITILFSIFILRTLQKTRKQKQIIEKQSYDAILARQIIEQKQKEILDSIYYARRIQQSLLPPEKYIERKVNYLKNRNKC